MNEQPTKPREEAEEPIRLRPTDCPSREEQMREFEPLPPLPAVPIPATPAFQFTVFDLMIVMVGVAGGLAGGTWMPPDIFAALLGLVTLLGLALLHFVPPESHFARLMWGTLVLAYFVAVGAAVFKGN
jgi:hypothetical protein